MGRGFLIYLAAVNLIALLAYGADKVSAKVGGRRIPDRALLGLALLGGCCGAGPAYIRELRKLLEAS